QGGGGAAARESRDNGGPQGGAGPRQDRRAQGVPGALRPADLGSAEAAQGGGRRVQSGKEPPGAPRREGFAARCAGPAPQGSHRTRLHQAGSGGRGQGPPDLREDQPAAADQARARRRQGPPARGPQGAGRPSVQGTDPEPDRGGGAGTHGSAREPPAGPASGARIRAGGQGQRRRRAGLRHVFTSGTEQPHTEADDMATNIEEIAEKLDSLTLLEASQLSKLLQEKWGVSAAAAVAVAAPAQGGAAAGGAAATEEKTEFDVILSAAGEKK